MTRKRKVRDLVYVSGNLDEKLFYSHGIEFREFVESCEKRPENLILLKHHFDNAQWNFHSRLDYVGKEEIDNLIDDDVYGYGDFCWVDIINESVLDKLNDNEIADLLFFAHLTRPLNRVIISKIMNRFAYYAHDDGWFNKLYVRNLKDYETILANVIIDKLRKITNRTITAFPADISSFLLDSTVEGLFIDFARITKNRTEIRLPVAVIGHHTDMDKVYNYKNEISSNKVWLEYSKKKWKLIIDI